MKISLFFILLIYCWECTTEKSLIVSVDSTNFTKFKETHNVFVLYFFLDWCTACIRAFPEYELAAQKLMQHNPPIPLLATNGRKDPGLANQFNVIHYPTIMVFYDGDYTKYDGPIISKDLVEHIKNAASPAYKLCADKSDISLNKNRDEPVLLGLFNSTKSEAFKKFSKIAKKAQVYLKAMVSTEISVRTEYSSQKSEYAMFLLRPFRFEKRNEDTVINVTDLFTTNSLSTQQLLNKILRAQIPPIGSYNKYTAYAYDRVNDLLICVIPYTVGVSEQTHSALNNFVDRLREISEANFPGKVNWVIADGADNAEFIDTFHSSTDEGDNLIVGCKIGERKHQLHGKKPDINAIMLFLAKEFFSSDGYRTNNVV